VQWCGADLHFCCNGGSATLMVAKRGAAMAFWFARSGSRKDL